LKRYDFVCCTWTLLFFLSHDDACGFKAWLRQKILLHIDLLVMMMMMLLLLLVVVDSTIISDRLDGRR